jgi:hypothetical protein
MPVFFGLYHTTFRAEIISRLLSTVRTFNADQDMFCKIHEFQRPSASIASPNFSLYSFSASVHTRAVPRFGNSSNDDKRSELNCSEASRGSNVGKWSMDITDSAGFPGLNKHSDLATFFESRIIPTLHRLVLLVRRMWC